MTYNIRSAEKKGKEALMKISCDTINHNFRHFMGDEAVDNFIHSGMADHEIIENFSDITVLEEGHEIIGLCIWKESLLHLLMITPKKQGTGAASYFIQAMSQEKLKIYSKIYLECFEGNKRANAFYHKLGWEVFKKEWDAGTGWIRLFYRKGQESQNRKFG